MSSPYSENITAKKKNVLGVNFFFAVGQCYIQHFPVSKTHSDFDQETQNINFYP